MDVVGVFTVDCRLCLCEALKYRYGRLLWLTGDFAAVDYFLNVFEMTMMMFFDDDRDKMNGAQSGAFDLADSELKIVLGQVQGRKPALEEFEIQPGVEHCGCEHIAGSAGKTIEVSNFHKHTSFKKMYRQLCSQEGKNSSRLF
jgi:hypothetical protein